MVHCREMQRLAESTLTERAKARYRICISEGIQDSTRQTMEQTHLIRLVLSSRLD